MARKPKYYVVWKGRRTGVFTDWDDCAEQVHGFPGARFRSFDSLEEAREALKTGAEREPANPGGGDGPILPSYSVDAA